VTCAYIERFSPGNYVLLVEYAGRLFREGKAVISGELAGVFERLGSNAENWQARLQKLARPVAGPFLRRQPCPVAGSCRASGRAPPGEPGRLRGAMTRPRRLSTKLVFMSLFRSHSQDSGDVVVDYVCRDRADHLWQFGVRSKPACRPRRTAVRGCLLMTRGNLAARHADCARLVDQSGKKGLQTLDGPQRGQVHPGLIWQDAVGARPSSRERTWHSLSLGCRIAAGPCRSQSR
jgi:hypothetical protein